MDGDDAANGHGVQEPPEAKPCAVYRGQPLQARPPSSRSKAATGSAGAHGAKGGGGGANSMLYFGCVALSGAPRVHTGAENTIHGHVAWFQAQQRPPSRPYRSPLPLGSVAGLRPGRGSRSDAPVSPVPRWPVWGCRWSADMCQNPLLTPSALRSDDASNKSRLRWTDDLHHRFEAAVSALGGLEYATPKVCLLHLCHLALAPAFHLRI
jgi:hypothetical protein